MSDLCLSPSISSSDFILSCPAGDIVIKKIENDYYTSLFQALDSDDDGRIRYKDVFPLLQRSGVSEKFLLLVWDDVCIYKEADIVLEQWLLLLKYLSYSKKYSNFCSKPSLADVVQDNELNTLDMFLDKLIDKYDVPSSIFDNVLDRCPFDIDIVSWENIVGSSMELGSTYSLYNIHFTTTLPQYSRMEWDAQRRYSDFAFLVEVLQKRYHGMIIPPLPPKYEHLLDTKYHTSQNKTDHVAQGRANDLSIFLKTLSRHPIINHSLEFMIFLQSSSSGFSSFRNALKTVTNMQNTNSSALSTSVDDMVLMALSTTTAVTGFATSMFGAVNNLFGISEQPSSTVEVNGSDLDMSDVRVTHQFKHNFERMLYIARATKKASLKLDEIILIDKQRVYDIDRIAHFFDKCGKMPGSTAFNEAVNKFAVEYDSVSTQLFSSLELQKIEVSNQLLNLGRFFHVLQGNQERRDADMARLMDQKNDVISYRKQLERARTMPSIKPVVINRLEASIEESIDNFEETKVEVKTSFESTERDLLWLADLVRFELQGRMLGFVQMRAAACQAESETLTKLYDDISNM
mmetsp:Transcript_1795/g.3389  ORF Transcript_1795/g.3389 Transcript_1795/m.3389 type:complete len:574 (+) Transcript_1795:66-1787(+)